ncbi:hypothetical protein Ctob_002682 [Chrysochromulina tobinii]|uniref:Uncharacterized protein n=1 Tax=Chrysochromulina tobinii TaxID=1460289 RepID=A0A0M0JFK6_9EUKA|nr:hypothetical protein Ctob_002682 [Chrysochromulina tobinii]|eukprot:KOO25235.1 hypothetical protein Ctob_002682 [Chrysochromulina sp. CCMP291]
MAVHLFLRGSLGADAESALIKSILERHGHSYVVHDVVNHPSSAEFMKRRCGTGVLSLPLLLVGKRTVWTASDMPPLEATGELQRMLAAAKTAHRARDEYKMGLSYLSGTGVRKDPFAAIDWLRRAANRGDAKAMAALGTLLVSGEAGVADEGEAGRWYDAAARKGNRSALLALGLLRLRQADHAPEGARNMLDHAARCFQQAGEEGVADAFVWLAHAQEKLARIDRGAKTGGGEGETFMETSAARQQRRVLYAKAAACGSAHGSFRLAHSLARGRLPPHPHAIMSPEILNGLQAATASGHAAAMFAAAQQGDAAGMAGLAECFLYGRGGVRRNVDVAVAWFAIAAAKKCPRAIVECEALTMAYGAGTVRRSRPTQRVLLATIGRGSKLYTIAKRCYEEGRGGEGRDSDGLRLRWAAQILNWCVRKGEARALVALGKLRLEGAGVTPSTEAAATLFERAAEHQHGPGALALARLHWEVRGDVFAAFVWFRIGAALGATAATAPLAQLASTLHPSLAAKAELRAAKWLKLHTGLAEMPPLASKETPLSDDDGYYSGSYYSDEDEDDAPGQPGGAPPLSTAGYSPYGIAPPAKAEARGATAKTYSYNSESYRTGYSAGTDGPLAGVVDRQSKSAFADFTGKQQDDAEAEDEVAHGKDVVNLADIASSDLYDYYDD